MRTQYDIFISHAWSYDDRYKGIINLLDSDPSFKYRNYSVPKHDPLVDPSTAIGKRVLEDMLSEQIRQCSCFILASGMYVYHKEWIQIEINWALKYKKPIVSIKRRGAQITPKYVEEVSTRLVGWQARSIVSAIQEVCP